MKGWMDLGVVDTIYEEDHEDASCSNSPPASASVFHCLQTKVDSWTRATGVEPDVVIHVQDRSFHLHMDPLISCSSYLRRQLQDPSSAVVTLPSIITAETFAVVATFCYHPDIIITPFNVAPLHIAAEVLDMIEDIDENLKEKTEKFFHQVVAISSEIAETVLCSCLKLMPEAEAAACLASWCVTALLALTEKGDSVKRSWIDTVIALKVEELLLILDSMRLAKTHDNLYKIISLYLKDNNCQLTEEERNRIAGSIDCNRLSPQLLVHAVQNPSMPLRFVVQAMLVEQFNTRISVFSATSGACAPAPKLRHKNVTLGALLQRDAALRHVAELKASMEATNEKILSLECDLRGMKARLKESEKKRESGKSESFRFSLEENKRRERESASAENVCIGSSKRGKSLGRLLINGMKKVFRTSKMEGSSTIDPESNTSSMGDENVIKEERLPTHRRNRSFA